MRDRFSAVGTILERAIAAHAFPGAVIEVGTATHPLWQQAFGTLTYVPDARAVTLDTIYDLASLTKVLATTPLVMRGIESGALALDDRVCDHVPRWEGTDRRDVTLRDLLAHSSGLPGHRPFFRGIRGRDAFELAICTTPLAYAPRSRAVYSDLGFILLGFILAGGIGLAGRFDVYKQQTASAADLQFLPPALWLRRTAPTSDDPWRGHVLVGDVEDENAAALGGVAGHAGLFGTAAALGDQARHLLQILDGRTGAYRRATAELFIRRGDVPGSSRALGWDTMLPTSSCGTRLSPRAFGHTGFTGTSLWIDPERGIYVVLLTNRVHPTRANDAITQVRPLVHDAVVGALEDGGAGD